MPNPTTTPERWRPWEGYMAHAADVFLDQMREQMLLDENARLRTAVGNYYEFMEYCADHQIVIPADQLRSANRRLWDRTHLPLPPRQEIDGIDEENSGVAGGEREEADGCGDQAER